MKLYDYLLKYNFWISIIFICLYISPYFFLGQDAYVCLYDILEYLPMYKIVASKLEYLLADNNYIIPNVLSGLPRVSYPSEMNIQVWLFYFFDPFVAYLINITVIHFVAFFSARLFLKEQMVEKNWFGFSFHHLNRDEVNLSINLSALYFALLPFWTFGGLSIAGMPLIFNAFLNFLNNKIKTRDILIIVLYPFYSDFIFSNSFVILMLLMIYAVYLIKHKKLNLKFLTLLVFFTFISLFSEYRIILSALKGFESHRSFFNPNFSLSLSDFMNKVLNNFNFYLYSYSDSSARHYPYLFLLALFALFLSILFNHKKVFIYLSLILLLTLFFAYLKPLAGYVLFALEKLMPDIIFKLIKGISFRFQVLNIFLWLNVTFIILVYISSISSHSKKIISYIFLMFNIYLLFTVGKVLNLNTYKSLESPLANNLRNNVIQLNYRSYFDSNLFNQIDSFIQKKYNLQKHQYRVASVTDSHPSWPLFSPSVLQFNNFYTIDGYNVYYPKSYKEIFGKIIEKELDKQPSGFYSFKTYGNRVYICTTDTTNNGEINRLDLNYEVLKQLNCKFLFSRKRILYPDSHLVFLKTFQGIYWKINLYEIK